MKKLIRSFFLIYLLIFLSSMAAAQRQTGCIKGKIADVEGFPLPGASVYIDSPSLLSIQTYTTSASGKINFHALPPGRYKITVDMPGFKTVNIENIIIRVGMTVYIDVAMEMTIIEEEIPFKIPSPTLDSESAKIAVVIEEDLLEKIPFRRDLHDIINSAAGVISDYTSYPQVHIIHGSTARGNIYALDGTKMNDPVGMSLLTNINFDAIGEVELETGAHPADVGSIDGGFINVVTKSGGNGFSGGATIYHTNDKIAKQLYSEDEIANLGTSPAPMDKSLWDVSFSLGGSILEDMLWFFTNVRMINQSSTTSFIPWTDPQGNNQKEYYWDNKDKLGFFKLTFQFLSKFRVTGLFNFADYYRPAHAFHLDWNLPEEATRILDHARNYSTIGILNYSLDQDTFLDLKGGYVVDNFPLLLNEDTSNDPRYYDESSGYIWGSGMFNEVQRRTRLQANMSITRVQDDLFGVDHEFKAGGEYEYCFGEWNVWKEDNLMIHYNNGNPYFFSMAESPVTGSTVGKGKVSFFTVGKLESELKPRNELRRIAFFVQDSMCFGRRLTLNLGLRFDRSLVNQLPSITKESGNPVSLKIGEELIEPTAGINPFTEHTLVPWDDLIVWNAWSPRISLIFDVFGKGKTLFKASFSRYKEYLMLQYAYDLNPFYSGRSHQFFWYDENMDGNVDVDDTYVSYAENYRLYAEGNYQKRIDPEIDCPYTDEYIIGLQNELFNDFSIKINYIYRNKKGIFENVPYDPDLDMEWYEINEDTESYWVPFHTFVPEVDDFPDTSVSLYFPSKDSPLFFDRFKNVSELNRKYRAFEFVFKKRMSNNWQMNGSLVLSKSTGNINSGYYASSGNTNAANSPNYFVNNPGTSRLDYDRPLAVKLMGTYEFPYDFFLSFYFTHMSGTPWTRSATIIPPSSWIEENNAYGYYVNVLLEEPGLRRNQAFNNLDIRVEKKLRFAGFKSINAYLDVSNLLGNKYKTTIRNDGGYWFPEKENSKEGTYILSPNYDKVTSLYGVRVFRFSLRFSF